VKNVFIAKRVKAIIKPEVLVWCRTSAGFSIADAEKALGKGVESGVVNAAML
jgi:hypothetical protein